MAPDAAEAATTTEYTEHTEEKNWAALGWQSRAFVLYPGVFSSSRFPCTLSIPWFTPLQRQPEPRSTRKTRKGKTCAALAWPFNAGLRVRRPI